MDAAEPPAPRAKESATAPTSLQNYQTNILFAGREGEIEFWRYSSGWFFRRGSHESGPWIYTDLVSLETRGLIAEALEIPLEFSSEIEDEKQWKEEEKKRKLAENLTKSILKAIDWEETRPLSLEDLKNILDLTIKHDDVNKVITFLCMLSAYTDEDQFNVSFRAESSTGKSYIPLETAKLFPSEDVIEIAYSSPTAFFHDAGEYDKETNLIHIDLEHKILIFLDQPHAELIERLKPLLSHDRRELLLKITDKSEKGGNRTKNVLIRGFPSVLFCTVRLNVNDEEATRMILLSPETSQEKLREAIELRIMRDGDRIGFQEWLESQPERLALKARIKRIRDAGIKEIKIPHELAAKIEAMFLNREQLQPRHQRDVARVMALAKTMTLLNLFSRERPKPDIIVASEEDIEAAISLWKRLAEPQELGIPPYVYEVFKKVVVPAYFDANPDWETYSTGASWNGITRRQIMARYFDEFGRLLSERTLTREILPALEAAGLIEEEPDPTDRRRKLVHVTNPKKWASTLGEKNMRNEGGV